MNYISTSKVLNDNDHSTLKQDSLQCKQCKLLLKCKLLLPRVTYINSATFTTILQNRPSIIITLPMVGGWAVAENLNSWQWFSFFSLHLAVFPQKNLLKIWGGGLYMSGVRISADSLFYGTSQSSPSVIKSSGASSWGWLEVWRTENFCSYSANTAVISSLLISIKLLQLLLLFLSNHRWLVVTMMLLSTSFP